MILTRTIDFEPSDYFKHFESVKEGDFENALTFDQWIENGRCVLKGEKSIGRDKKGQPLFAFRQTSILAKRRSSVFEDDALTDSFGDDDVADDMGLTIWDTF